MKNIPIVKFLGGTNIQTFFWIFVFCNVGSGQVRFFYDETEWLDEVGGCRVFFTDAEGVMKADEVDTLPLINAQLPGFLTFDKDNTQLPQSFTVENTQKLLFVKLYITKLSKFFSVFKFSVIMKH